MSKLGINGFGRIGRLVLQAIAKVRRGSSRQAEGVVRREEAKLAPAMIVAGGAMSRGYFWIR